MGPILYTIYTSDLPEDTGLTIATFADDTAILTSHKDLQEASGLLQESLANVDSWLTKWRISASASKSVQLTFTLRRGYCPPVKMGHSELPHQDSVKNLGFYRDRRLTWKKHLQTKRDEINLRCKGLYWLLGPNSKLSLDNKLLNPDLQHDHQTHLAVRHPTVGFRLRLKNQHYTKGAEWYSQAACERTLVYKQRSKLG